MSFAVRSSFAAMLLYWWFAIFRPQDFMYWDINSLRIPLLAAVLFFIPAILRKKYPQLGSYYVISMLLWVTLTTLSSFIAGCDNGDLNLNAAYIYTLMLTMFLTIPLLSTRERILGMLFNASVSLCIISSKAGIVALTKGSSLYDANIGSGSFTGTNAMALGSAIALFFMIFIIQILSHKESVAKMHWLMHVRLIRWGILSLLWIIVLGSVYFVIATQSRGSGLAMIVGAAIWIMLHPRRIATVAACSILASILLLFVAIPEEYSDRLASAFVEEEDLDSSAASRSHFWNTATQMAGEHVLGVGVGCYPTYYNVYDESLGQYGRNRSAHSSHYAVIAELGYVGFSLWVFVLLKTYWTFFKIRKYSGVSRTVSVNSRFFFCLSNAMIAAQSTFIIGGAFYEMTYTYYIWLIFGIAYAADRLYQDQSAETIIDEKQIAVES